MLALTSLFLPCLISLALAGAVDCWKVLDLFKASAQGHDEIKVWGSVGISFTHNSCRGKLTTNLTSGDPLPIELTPFLTEVSFWLYESGNIDVGLWDKARINQYLDQNIDVEFEFVKDAKASAASHGSTAGSIDPDDTCYNPTNFTALVQDDCHTSFNAWTDWMKLTYPGDSENITWPGGRIDSIISDKWTCQFIAYNNVVDIPVQLNLTSITDQVQKHIFDPCISNGWYGGWSKDHTGVAVDLNTKGLVAWFVPWDLINAVTWTVPFWLLKSHNDQDGRQPQHGGPKLTPLGDKSNASLLTWGT
ncbi:hypothetical protein QBC40DRAFT_256810 [Triangularia verruculosa]|uniref:Uncharacterized protein n=1 Tax=Triangularia verruculosa TaxID=2587418 RepID=A0AAN7AT81_9PEZI|nr:hypothetical protein QBC40DRAFT_256810 [Triangularia verruculosa]